MKPQPKGQLRKNFASNGQKVENKKADQAACLWCVSIEKAENRGGIAQKPDHPGQDLKIKTKLE
jgi:hypothetical protein